jgi:hypothetical protein
LFLKTNGTRRNSCSKVRKLFLSYNFIVFHFYRSEVDIKGHDGVIYKGRIDAGRLPTVDMQKKNSVVLLAPPSPQRYRSDSHPMSANNDQRPNGISPIIPNLEPTLTRENTFT